MWGMGDVSQEEKVLYNVQKGIVQYYKKKCGEGRRQYLNPKYSLCN